MIDAPPRLEDTDPELAEAIRLVANRQHPTVQSIQAGAKRCVVVKRNGSTSISKVAGRNDPCPCGSGKKFKKCHGR